MTEPTAVVARMWPAEAAAPYGDRNGDGLKASRVVVVCDGLRGDQDSRDLPVSLFIAQRLASSPAA